MGTATQNLAWNGHSAQHSWPGMRAFGTVDGDGMDGEIKAFLDFLAFDRDRAPNTTRRYGELLNRFLAFTRVTLGRAAVTPAEVDRGMVELFVRHGGRPLDGAAAPSTRNVRLAALRGFFGYLVGEGRLLIDPTAGLRPTKVKSHSPGYLTEAEFARLLAIVETATTEHYAARDIAVLTVMFHCGLRISEALSLTLPQVNLDALRFHAVVRKGRIVEDVAMNRTAAEAVRRWLLYRKTYRRADETTALFLSDRSRPLSVRALQRNFARYVAAAGLQDRHLTPHSMRHSCATALVGHGVPLSTVSAVLAHQKIETTKIYVRLDGREKREAVALLDPRPARPPRANRTSGPANGFSLTGIPAGPQLGSDLARNGRSAHRRAEKGCPVHEKAWEVERWSERSAFHSFLSMLAKVGTFLRRHLGPNGRTHFTRRRFHRCLTAACSQP